MQPTYVSLFAGAGGFDVGFDAAGFRCLAQVEIDKTARSVLARHWPDVPQFADVRNFGAQQVPTCDVVVGGFPCQDVSTAGRRKGFAGVRSSLWWEMLRVVDELKPQWVVFENVPGLLSQQDEEYASERCLCGWDFGWGGVSDGGADEADEYVRREIVSRHDPKGAGGSSAFPRCVRRDAADDSRADGKVGSGVDVERFGAKRRNGSQSRLPAHDSEGATGEAPSRTGSDEGRVASRLDGRGTDQSSGDPRRCDGVESQGAVEAEVADSRECVCPGCGRRAVVAAEPRPAGRLTMATVVRSLRRVGYHGGWRVLDAQFFGVPQQRRRVFGCFARGDLGAERCAEILALPEGVRRRTPPRRKKGQGVAAPPTRGAGSSGKQPAGRRQEDDTNLVVAPALRGCGVGSERVGDTRGQDCLIVGTFTETKHADYEEASAAGPLRSCGGQWASNLAVFGGGECGGNATRVAAALTAKAGTRQDFDTENFVLIQDARAGMENKSQNGAGWREGGVSYTVDTHSLTAEGADASEDGTGRGTPIVAAFMENQRHEVRESPVCGAQSAADGGRPGTVTRPCEPAVRIGTIVRRLTPLECERLMGWPDEHTKYRADGSVIADGPRYRLCGNGVVGTVSKWLAARMMRHGFPQHPTPPGS